LLCSLVAFAAWDPPEDTMLCVLRFLDTLSLMTCRPSLCARAKLMRNDADSSLDSPCADVGESVRVLPSLVGLQSSDGAWL